MSGAGVSVKLMSFAELRKLGVELAHVFRRRIFVFRAKMTLDRTIDLARALERRRTFAERHHRAAAIKHHAGFDIPARRRHEIDKTTTHAKADDPELSAIDRRMAFEKADCPVDILDDRRIAESCLARRIIVLTVGTVAMIKIGSHGDVALER